MNIFCLSKLNGHHSCLLDRILQYIDHDCCSIFYSEPKYKYELIIVALIFFTGEKETR